MLISHLEMAELVVKLYRHPFLFSHIHQQGQQIQGGMKNLIVIFNNSSASSKIEDMHAHVVTV